MTDPVKKTITPASWTKIATNVTTGYVRILDHSADYLYTHVDTGGSAPADRTIGAIFETKSMEIASTVAIDVYIYATKGGIVRYDA